MFVYEKKLQYPVRIKNTNPKLASIIISQYGGPNGELGAALRYLSQRYSMPFDEQRGLLTDIGTEELGHLEMVGTIVHINEVLDETVDITDGPSDAVVADGSVDFEDVCFSYSGDPDKLALRHITVHINSGETIGIIGGTGEGKSTLVNLIPRFYDTLSGTVRVGGRDVRDYTLEHLRDGVSMVLQNGALFSGTIAQNLRWGNANATQEQLREACAIACADEFIDRFPGGYETVLEQNAANLSGGPCLCPARW